MKNFELVRENTIEVSSKILYQIRALVDYPNGYATAGDLGGYIEKEENLSDWAWVGDNARVFNNAQVSGNAHVYNNARVFNNAQVSGNTQVSGNAQVYGDARVYDDAQVYDDACVFGNVLVCNNSQVYGNAWVYGNARVYNNACVFGNALVRDDAQVSGDAHISSAHHIIWFSNVGTENGILTAYKTEDGGIELTRGCFRGTIEEFITASKKKHYDFHHSQYLLLINYIENHFKHYK